MLYRCCAQFVSKETEVKLQQNVHILFFFKITLQKRNTPYQKNLSFACSILTYSRKTLHELSNVFVEHLLHDGIIKSFDPRPNSHVPDTAGLVLTIGL